MRVGRTKNATKLYNLIANAKTVVVWPRHTVYSYGLMVPGKRIVSLVTALDYIRVHDFYIMPIVLEIKNIRGQLSECR
jgi:hypothetical protein